MAAKPGKKRASWGRSNEKPVIRIGKKDRSVPTIKIKKVAKPKLEVTIIKPVKSSTVVKLGGRAILKSPVTKQPKLDAPIDRTKEAKANRTMWNLPASAALL